MAGKGVRCSREVRADRRNARACGTKPMYKSKSVKLHEVRMVEKCNIALREADFQVKSVKPPAVRTKGNHKDQEVP